MNPTLMPMAGALVLAAGATCAALGAAPHRTEPPPAAQMCVRSQQKVQMRTAQPLAVRQSYSRAAAAHRTVRPARQSSASRRPPRR